MYPFLIFILLFVNWVVFSGLLDGFHLTLGVLSCAFVTWISSDLVFENRSQTFGERMRQAIRLPGYLLWLLREIVDSNVHVLKLALSKEGGKQLHPSIVRWKSPLRTEFGRYMLANSITLTPGTVTIKIENENEFVVHAISRRTAKGLNGSMDRKIAAIFEPENAECGEEGAD